MTTGERRPLAALAIVVLIGAGCSSSSSETGTGSSDPDKSATPREKAVAYAECMRANGVSGFPDPDASGGLTIDGVLNGSSLDPDSAAWKAAVAACDELEPPGFTGDRDVSAREQEARLAFAECMRDNGVEDFPDPAKGDPLVDTTRIPSAAEPGGMNVLNAAMQECRDLSEAARSDP